MKGYDTINRYCGRLENSLKDLENKDEIVEEIRQHLQEQAESLVKEGCLPEAAELIAIEEMGSVTLLSREMKKYGEKIPHESEKVIDTVSDFRLKTQLEYSGWNTALNNIGKVRFRELFYRLFILFYTIIMWNFVNFIGYGAGVNDKPFIKVSGIACIMAVTVFSLCLSSLDRYLPFLCRRNIIIFFAVLAASVLLYPLFELFLLRWGFYVTDGLFRDAVANPILYYTLKLAVTFAVIAKMTFSKKYSRTDIVLLAVPAFLPLIGLALNGTGLIVLFFIILAYTAAASVYTTLYSRNKVVIRLGILTFCLIGLAEIAAVFEASLIQLFWK